MDIDYYTRGKYFKEPHVVTMSHASAKGSLPTTETYLLDYSENHVFDLNLKPGIFVRFNLIKILSSNRSGSISAFFRRPGEAESVQHVPQPEVP